ncbi:MAG: UDP-3-O-(3-hydroxymyristoyl)glucosamine N-acyltransferase [Chitinophagales bacterium]|nr:UDP-3-O-(3-hydroxymyristoyl)glucosamine N-acyltransferase [Chitinophagales bacterium]
MQLNQKPYTINELALIVNGQIIGDTNTTIHLPNKVEIATKEEISFIGNKKYIDYIHTSNAGILILTKALFKADFERPIILVDDAYNAFAQILDLFIQKDIPTISDKAIIDTSARIGNNCCIGANTIIGKNVQIGNDCIIYPNVTIYDNCIIGNHCIIHSGTVIGSDGFGFAPNKDGSFKKIPQLGNVIINDDVEIGANCTIDSATLGSTIIETGCKLDNLIQVAHNVVIGAHTVIAAQTGIAGSTIIGHHCMIGGQVGFVGHITIAPYTKINAQSGIAQSIKQENLVLSGSPAFNMRDYFKSSVYFKQLPDIIKRLSTLEEKNKNK